MCYYCSLFCASYNQHMQSVKANKLNKHKNIQTESVRERERAREQNRKNVDPCHDKNRHENNAGGIFGCTKEYIQLFTTKSLTENVIINSCSTFNTRAKLFRLCHFSWKKKSMCVCVCLFRSWAKWNIMKWLWYRCCTLFSQIYPNNDFEFIYTYICIIWNAKRKMPSSWYIDKRFGLNFYPNECPLWLVCYVLHSQNVYKTCKATNNGMKRTMMGAKTNLIIQSCSIFIQYMSTMCVRVHVSCKNY